jgi:hypothetical protein
MHCQCAGAATRSADAEQPGGRANLPITGIKAKYIIMNKRLLIDTLLMERGMEGHLKRIDNEVTRNGFDLDIKSAHSHIGGHKF